MTGLADRAIVVTGASTGIGRAVVTRAVKAGAHAFASVRKQSDADELVREFGGNVTPLLFDVVDEAAIAAGAAQVASLLGGRRLFGLVNNAGIAVSGPLLHLSADDLARQLDVNLVGVHRVTRAFAPLLGVDKSRAGRTGRIIMISSVGGRVGMPFVGPYSASKFALEGYAQSLRRELLLYGIDVIVVGPGSIATPIWDKAEQGDLKRFGHIDYAAAIERIAAFMIKQGKEGLPAERVGELIWTALNARKPKTRYAILSKPLANGALPRLLPARLVDNVIAKRLGFSKAA
jgi:NAD(P)-dependent dehydrogenase (short-subunit alcohol dehydrogenase family)